MKRIALLSAVASLVAGLAILTLDLFLLWRPRAGQSVTPGTLAYYGVVAVALCAVVLGACRHSMRNSLGALLLLSIGIGFLIDLSLASGLLLLPAVFFGLISGLAAIVKSVRAPHQRGRILS